MPYNGCMSRALICVVVLVLATFVQGQSNLYHPSKSSIKDQMKKAAAQKAVRANTTVNFVKPARNHRNDDFGVYHRRDRPRPFDTLIQISSDTNFALHGADYAVGYGWPVQYDDASASPMQGVLVVNNCSAHAYVAHVNLYTIQYSGRWHDCGRRPTPTFVFNP